jgi:hypothetical protein
MFLASGERFKARDVGPSAVTVLFVVAVFRLRTVAQKAYRNLNSRLLNIDIRQYDSVRGQ